MLRLSLKNGDYDKANALIAKLPDGSEKASSLRLLGRILWADTFRYRKEGEQAKADQARAAAEQALRSGLESTSSSDVGGESMKSALTLAKAYLDSGQPTKALQTLENPTYGPLALLEKLGSADDRFSADLFSTELQVVVQLMTLPDADPAELLNRAIAVMQKLQASVKGPDGKKRLSGTYVRMAKTIRAQLDRSNPTQRKKLVDAFRVFLDRVASTTTDPATLQWAATTLIELAESSMEPNIAKAKGQSAELLKTAITALQSLKQKQKEPSLTIDFQIGRAYRMSGEYKQAIDTFADLLKQKPMMLDAQVEAALAYEQWAGEVAPQFAGNAYKSALLGARPDAKKENVVWGWGKIGQLTMRDKQYKDTFFNARYHVALCRYLWGKATNDQRLIQKAETDITRVHTLHPNMGGPDQYKKFDQLLKTIQKELKKQPAGLPAV